VKGFSAAHLKRQTALLTQLAAVIRNLPALQKVEVGKAAASGVSMIAKQRRWAPSTELTCAAAIESALKRAQIFGAQSSTLLRISPWWECYIRDLNHRKRTQGRGPTVGITKEQMKRVMERLDGPVQLLTALAWAHAARVGNMLDLHPAWITMDMDASTVRILWKDSKTAATRGIYSASATMNKEQMKLLSQWLASRPQHAPIASGRQGLLIMAKMREALRAENTAADLRSIRRGSLRTMAKAGVDMATMMRISGHQSEQSLLIYIESGVEAEAIHHQTAAATANLVL
jgi:hypothetical protein